MPEQTPSPVHCTTLAWPPGSGDPSWARSDSNGASQEISDYRDRTRVANAGWGRWTPVNALAIGAHLIGSLQITRTDKSRIGAHRGVGSAALVKTGLTGAALLAHAPPEGHGG